MTLKSYNIIIIILIIINHYNNSVIAKKSHTINNNIATNSPTIHTTNSPTDLHVTKSSSPTILPTKSIEIDKTTDVIDKITEDVDKTTDAIDKTTEDVDKTTDAIDKITEDVTDTSTEEVIDTTTTTTTTTTSFENVYYPNGTLCSSFGIDDLTPYKYNYPIISADKTITNDELALYLPIYSSQSLVEKDSSIKHAIIAVHGYLRNADEMLCLGIQTANERTDTIIVAPYFSMEQVESTEWGTNIQGVTSDYLSAYWSSSSWMSGGDNSFDSRTSYDALDNLVDSIGNSGNFPGLEIITIAGYSAGAQMVNRYAWATDIDRNATANYDDWKMRYIISDASSYLYLDPSRPIAKCVPKRDKGDDVTCQEFEEPSKETIADCDNYDEWKYGLASFPDSGYSYLEKISTEKESLNSRTELFLQKDIRYIFGIQDSCNCNEDGYKNKDYCYVSGDLCSPNAYGGDNCCDTYPDSYSNDLSTTCGSNLQGYNRLQRGLVYMSYLEWYSGDKPKFTTMDMMHNCTDFFLSDELKDWVFDVEGLTFNDFIMSAITDKDLTTTSAVTSKHRPIMQVNSQYTLLILAVFLLAIFIGNVIINSVLGVARTDGTNRLGTRLSKRDLFTDGDYDEIR